MELDELKAAWQHENKRLEEKIKLNENLIRKMNLDKTISEFDKMRRIAVIGRNLAVVYFLVSMGMAWFVIGEPLYSIPAIAGGLAMLWSFKSHLPLHKPDYKTISVIALQKTIYAFRIHTAAHSKYDALIVSFWLLTLAPLQLRYFANIMVYEDTDLLLKFLLIAFTVIVLIIVLSKNGYEKWGLKLRESEARLEEILQFEKL